MMYPYLFGSFPNFRRSYYHSGYHNFQSGNLAQQQNAYFPKPSESHSSYSTSHIPSSYDYVSKNEVHKTNFVQHNSTNDYPSEACPEEEEEEKPIFEILGIRLYSDDLILLALLFFLYKEEVKDPSLFISLILLLLS
ncbi:MAG: hypothetical protein ACLU84_04280 [Clostridia bacterium]